MQLTAIICGFFGTGAKAELYSLSLFHLDGDQVRRYGSLVSTSQTTAGTPAGTGRIDPLNSWSRAPELEQVWGEVRRYFTHSLVICTANEAAVLSGALERRGMYPPVMFTLSIRELAKAAGQTLGEMDQPEQLADAFRLLRRQYRDWETCIGMIKPSLPVRKKTRLYLF